MDAHALEGEVRSSVTRSEQLCHTGADIMTPEEYDSVRRHKDQLKDTYTKLTSAGERLRNR